MFLAHECSLLKIHNSTPHDPPFCFFLRPRSAESFTSQKSGGSGASGASLNSFARVGGERKPRNRKPRVSQPRPSMVRQAQQANVKRKRFATSLIWKWMEVIGGWLKESIRRRSRKNGDCSSKFWYSVKLFEGFLVPHLRPQCRRADPFWAAVYGQSDSWGVHFCGLVG